LGLDSKAASSVVLINDPFFPVCSGWGGGATISFCAANLGTSGVGEATAVFFVMRFGFFTKPPVEKTGLFTDVGPIRDRAPEPSVCAGEASLERGVGASQGDCGGNIILLACGFSAALWTDGTFVVEF
jgi:hypothetical protein